MRKFIVLFQVFFELIESSYKYDVNHNIFSWYFVPNLYNSSFEHTITQTISPIPWIIGGIQSRRVVRPVIGPIQSPV